MDDVVPDFEALRRSYSRFLEGDRVLLSGHSHQAWPDAVRDALGRFFDDSARFADAKWAEVIFPKMEAVGARILERMGFARGDAIAFGRSTHELVFRLLTALPGFASRTTRPPRIVTTQSEFHSLYRQLSRLEEAGIIEVDWVPSEPREGLADRLLDALAPGTAMLALSAVFYEDAYVMPRLAEIVERAAAIGALPLIDAYHAFNAVPLAWGPAKEALFVTAGGYKYAGFGEGVCWLRIPPRCELRPIDTGWFADFASLARERRCPTTYGDGGARFAGATFDASSIYRAEAALDHWDRFGLDVERLRAISLRQSARIIARIDEAGGHLSVVSARDPRRRGGFIAVRHERAAVIADRLRARGVLVDARGDRIRLGPAPYVSDDEIDRGLAVLIEETR